MLEVINEKIISHLSSHSEELLQLWTDGIVVYAGDPFLTDMKHNGQSMIELVTQGLGKSEAELEELVEQFALRISEQRVKANINIGAFVYNVNIGRSILYQHLLQSDFSKHELPYAIKRINFFFDKFLYFSVSYYTEAKNKIIEEKTQFIDTTHKDRLTLLGQMTSSFIHEFRNPLTSIQGFIQLLKAEDPSIKYLDIISSELEQLNFRISQFLLLSKKELIGKDKSLFSLNELIDEVFIFLYPSILDSKVRITRTEVENLEIYGYVDEIRQVLINIIFNAIDVLNGYRMDPVIELICRYDEQGHIIISISNNGPMIPETLLQSIFEPFVTTKTLGTGLGLFVCREIIEKHKGTLACDSTEEKTIFTMTMPIPSMNESLLT